MRNKYAQNLETLAHKKGEKKLQQAITEHGAGSDEAHQAKNDIQYAAQTLAAIESGNPSRCAFAQEKIYMPDWEDGRADTGYEEALARFNNAEDKPLAPKDIFPALGRLGLTDYADARIVHLIAQEAVSRPHHAPPLGVNIMPKSLEDPDFRDYVEDALTRHGINIKHRLVLEITEMGELHPNSIAWLKSIREQHGTYIALDDFGSRRGHHTLQNVEDLQPNIIKLDGFGVIRPCFELEGEEHKEHLVKTKEIVKNLREKAPDAFIIGEFTETPGEYRRAVTHFGLDGVQSRELQAKYEQQMTLTAEENKMRWTAYKATMPEKAIDRMLVPNHNLADEVQENRAS